MVIMYKNRLLCIITNYVNKPWHIHNMNPKLKVQNTFSQSGNDSKWFLTKIIFQNRYVALETPSRPTPLHGKCHLKFPFWFFESVPKLWSTLLLVRAGPATCSLGGIFIFIFLLSVFARARPRLLSWTWERTPSCGFQSPCNRCNDQDSKCVSRQNSCMLCTGNSTPCCKKITMEITNI